MFFLRCCLVIFSVYRKFCDRIPFVKMIRRKIRAINRWHLFKQYLERNNNFSSHKVNSISIYFWNSIMLSTYQCIAQCENRMDIRIWNANARKGVNVSCKSSWKKNSNEKWKQKKNRRKREKNWNIKVSWASELMCRLCTLILIPWAYDIWLVFTFVRWFVGIRFNHCWVPLGTSLYFCALWCDEYTRTTTQQ